MAGHDHFWLSALPTSPNSIQWSQDNLLAIAAGHSVTILNPARLDGARGHTATPTPDLDARLVGCVPRDYHTSAALSKTVLAEARMAESNDRMKLYISSIAWSPMGCSPQGGCLLTTATSDFKVRLYTAPCPKLGSEWQQVLDLTQLYKRILRESMWQGVDEASSDLNLVTAANAKVGGGHSPVRQAILPQPLHAQDNLPEPGATGCPDQAPVPQPLHAQDNLPEPGATVCPDQAPVPQPLHAQDNLQEPGATGCPDEVLRLKGGGATASSDDDVFRLKSGGPAGCTDDGHRLKVRGTARSAADELGLNGRGTAKDTDGVLRLKGGGSSKRKLDKASSSPPDKGDALHHSLCVGDLGEVMNNEEGLTGCWFTGRLADILGSFGLFEYDELNADETTDAHLKEWFPLPGCIPLTAQELEGHREQYDCHLGPGFLMRPCPPIDLIQRGAPVVPGQFIDAWHDGGWWQTSVISYSSDSDEVHCNLFSGTQQVVVPLSSTRLTTVWSLQGIWSVDSAASIPVKDENTVVDEPKPKRKRPATPKAATEPKSVPPKSTPKVVTEPRAVPSKSTPKSASLPKSVPPKSAPKTAARPKTAPPKGSKSTSRSPAPEATPQLKMVPPKGPKSTSRSPAPEATPQIKMVPPKGPKSTSRSPAAEATPLLQTVPPKVPKSTSKSPAADATPLLQTVPPKAPKSTSREPDEATPQSPTTAPPAATDGQAPPTVPTDGQAPPTDAIDGQAPPTAATDGQAPSTATTDGQAPPTAATDGRAPPTAATDGQAPPTAAIDGQAPPTAATDGRAPPTAATDGQAPPQSRSTLPPSATAADDQTQPASPEALRSTETRPPTDADDQTQATSPRGLESPNTEAPSAVDVLTAADDPAVADDPTVADKLIQLPKLKPVRTRQPSTRVLLVDDQTLLTSPKPKEIWTKTGPRVNVQDLPSNSVDVNTFRALFPWVDFRIDEQVAKQAAAMILKRFEQLRLAHPPDELPEYRKGQHLMGVDMDLFSRAYNELMLLHGDAVKGQGVNESELIKESKNRIRKNIIQTFDQYLRHDLSNKTPQLYRPGDRVETELNVSGGSPKARTSRAEAPFFGAGGEGVLPYPDTNTSGKPAGGRFGTGDKGTLLSPDANTPKRQAQRKRKSVVEAGEDSEAGGVLEGQEAMAEAGGSRSRRPRRASAGRQYSSSAPAAAVSSDQDSGDEEYKVDDDDDGDDDDDDHDHGVEVEDGADEDSEDLVTSEETIDLVGAEAAEQLLGFSKQPARRARQKSGTRGQPSSSKSKKSESRALTLSGPRGLRLSGPQARRSKHSHNYRVGMFQVKGRAPFIRVLFRQQGKVKDNIENKRMQTLDLTTNPSVPNVVYDRRQLACAWLHVSWSPTLCGPRPTSSSGVGASMDRYALLACGNKLGQLVLWRTKLPTYSLSPSPIDLIPRMELLGHLPAHMRSPPNTSPTSQPNQGVHVVASAWTVLPSALRWGTVAPLAANADGDLLLLVTGGSDGSIKLWSARPQHLCGSDAAALFTLLGQICPPDDLPPTSLDLVLAAPDEFGEGAPRRLLVAAGKPVGSVFVWGSARIHPHELDEANVAAATSLGRCALQQHAHGLMTVSGVALNAYQSILSSSGLDGALRSWHVRGDTSLTELPPPPRHNPKSSFAGPSYLANHAPTNSNSAYGLAASGNGCMLATVRRRSNVENEAMTRNAMNWDKVATASIHIHTLFGAGLLSDGDSSTLLPSPSKLEFALPGILRNFSLQCASPAMMWDLAVAAASGAWSVADPESAVDTLMALTPGSSDKQDAEADAHMGEEEDEAEPSNPGDEAEEEEEAGEMVVTQYQGIGKLGKLLDNNMAEAAARRKKLWIRRMHQLRSLSAHIQGVRHMAYQLEAPFREAVSAFLASPSPGSFFKGVPIVAWRGLQAATALRQLSLLNLTDRLSKEPLDIDLVGRGPDAPQDEAVLKRLQETEPWLLAIPQSLDELSQEMQAGEVELLQVHVWYSLSKGLDASIGGGGEALGCKVPKRQLAPVEGAAGAQAGEATAEHPLWRLLMADWVSLNMRQLQQHADELLRLAATVYVICGLQAPMNTQPPSREPIPSPCDDEILMCGGPLDSASSAIGSVDGIPIKLPRCSSSMMVCASSNVWHCHGCKRSYQDPPFNRLDGTPDVPFCLFCGVRLGARAPNQFLQMPALEVVALPPEPVTFD